MDNLEITVITKTESCIIFTANVKDAVKLMKYGKVIHLVGELYALLLTSMQEVIDFIQSVNSSKQEIQKPQAARRFGLYNIIPDIQFSFYASKDDAVLLEEFGIVEAYKYTKGAYLFILNKQYNWQDILYYIHQMNGES